MIFSARLFKEPERHMKLIILQLQVRLLEVSESSHLTMIMRFPEEKSDYYESHDGRDPLGKSRAETVGYHD